MEELTLEKFEEASEIVSRVTLETKLKYSEYFSNQTGNKVYFKPENMQYTGAKQTHRNIPDGKDNIKAWHVCRMNIKCSAIIIKITEMTI